MSSVRIPASLFPLHYNIRGLISPLLFKPLTSDDEAGRFAAVRLRLHARGGYGALRYRRLRRRASPPPAPAHSFTCMRMPLCCAGQGGGRPVQRFSAKQLPPRCPATIVPAL